MSTQSSLNFLIPLDKEPEKVLKDLIEGKGTTMVKAPRRFQKSLLLTKYLLMKEIECMEQKQPMSVAFFVSGKRHWEQHISKFTLCRGSLAMPEETKRTSAQFRTKHGFSIDCQDSVRRSGGYDIVIMDEFWFNNWKSTKLLKLIKECPRVIMIGTPEGESFDAKEFMEKHEIKGSFEFIDCDKKEDRTPSYEKTTIN